MTENSSNIRWSKFKVLITFILMGLGGYAIYIALSPVLDGEYDFKSMVNVLFAMLIIFFMLCFLKISHNYQFVFWACGFGLIVFLTVMFINYEDLF